MKKTKQGSSIRVELVPLAEVMEVLRAEDRQPLPQPQVKRRRKERKEKSKVTATVKGSRTNKKSRSLTRGTSNVDLSKDLWISPHLNLRGRDGNRGWERTGYLPPGAGTRLLELADVALGIKKPELPQPASTLLSDTTKKEPYSL